MNKQFDWKIKTEKANRKISVSVEMKGNQSSIKIQQLNFNHFIIFQEHFIYNLNHNIRFKINKLIIQKINQIKNKKIIILIEKLEH